jgi:hypothetical protein
MRLEPWNFADWVEQEKGREFSLQCAEDVWAQKSPVEDLDSREEDSTNAWRRISNNYAHFDENGHADVAPDSQVMDMSSANERLSSLNILTQQSATAPEGSLRDQDCAASSLVAAAVVGDGTDGLLALMDGMHNNASKDYQKRLEQLEGKGGDLTKLRDKIANGDALTVGDMHTLQIDLDGELHAKDRELGKPGGDGVTGSAEESFLEHSPELAAMMQLHHLAINNIDTDGDGKSNHATLNIGDNLVYDPWMRNGGQIVTSQADVADYHMVSYSTKDGSDARASGAGPLSHYAD